MKSSVHLPVSTVASSVCAALAKQHDASTAECRGSSWPVWVALGLAVAFSVGILAEYLNLSLLDQHGFRQTQTAISAFWLTKHFSLFSYQTPVLGMPWSVPFEFPIYQLLVAGLWKLFPFLSLDAAARLISWGAWAACAYPIHRIMMRYFRDVLASAILLCLFFSSPFSVFWARTAMIETTALLFSLMFLWQLIRLADSPSWRIAGFASFWGVLAIVTKVTTMPSFMLAGGLHILFVRRQTILTFWKPLCLPFALSMVALLLWTHHADAVKSENFEAQHLTSASISWWNFGTLAQKLSPALWGELLQRNLHELYGSLTIFGLSCVFALLCGKRMLLSALYALFLFMVPMLIFTNLYVVHTYYQVANMIFLLAFTAILLYGAALHLPKSVACLPVLMLTAAFALAFQSIYSPGLKSAAASPPPLVIGRMLNMLTQPDDRVVVLGAGWDSSTLYYAQRRGFSYPWWIDATEYPAALESLPQRLGGNPAAVVLYVRQDPPLPPVKPGEEEPHHYKWTKYKDFAAIENTGTVFPALLSTMRKVRIADAIVYYQDRPQSVVSLLRAPVSGVSPQTSIRYENNTLVVTAESNDPYFEVPVSLQPDKHYVVRLRMQGPQGFVQLFVRTGEGAFSESGSIIVWLDENMDTLIPLPANASGPTLRLDPGNQPGVYTISDFALLQLTENSEIIEPQS